MKNNIGKLIVIDGIDGSGKSSLSKELNQYFGTEVVVKEAFEKREMIEELDIFAKHFNTRKEKVFSEQLINVVWMMELMLNIRNDVENLLNNGKNVILVRYILSAKVYSLATTNADISQLFDIYSLLPRPYIGFYIKVSVEEAVKRIKKRNEIIRFYENEEFLNKISNTYESLILSENYPIIEIDGSKDISIMAEEVINYLDMLCGWSDKG